jgi:hypothetical protein
MGLFFLFWIDFLLLFCLFRVPNADCIAPEIVIIRNEDYEGSGYGRPVDVWAMGICLYILYDFLFT